MQRPSASSTTRKRTRCYRVRSARPTARRTSSGAECTMRKSIDWLACAALLMSLTFESNAAGVTGPVRIVTLDPGHFHAALVQKFMYQGVDPQVHVYAPPGDDVIEHMKRIEAFNTRKDQPTRW